MPRLRPHLDRDYWPLVARAALIVLCASVTAVSKLGPQVAVPPALLMLLVAALGTVPLPDTVPPWLQPLTESLAAALVVGALQGKADLFLPYVLVPLAAAGLASGVAAALTAAGLVGAVMLLTSLLAHTDPATGASLTADGTGSTVSPWTWIVIFVAVSLVAAWARRVSTEAAPRVEPAYADAHRLLSELHVVARQLSLGLDPPTLAAALVDDLRGLVDGAEPTVLIRSAGGRFVPVVGDLPTPFAESVVVDAWLTADLTRRVRGPETVAALPVQMGERVVAVVVLTGGELQDTSLAACRQVVAQAGPRLASALLFDDVRRLATVDERMRLAREIHDGIAQDVASVGYLLDDIARDAEPDVAGRLAQVREHLGSLVSDLRLSIFDLRAGVDENVGLARTLGDYVQRVGSQAGLAVHVSTEESQHRLPVAAEVELLRIVQEAVTNVRRHAAARNLWLTVAVDPPRAAVTVADDGRGLQPGRADSIGIVGMKERAARIGGRLTVENRPEGGTRVEVLLEPHHNGPADPSGPSGPPAAARRLIGKISNHQSMTTAHMVTSAGVTSSAQMIGGGWSSTGRGGGTP